MSFAAAGNEHAWNDLVCEFGSMIRAVTRSHRLRDADAADVAQATWLRLLEHVGRLHDPARVGAWLATTARRECLRVIRESARSVPCDELPEHASMDAPAGEALIMRERDAALWRSFDALRPSDQTLLHLLIADPAPAYEEIAARLSMPIGSIGPTRQRALARLRRELADHGSLGLVAEQEG